MKFTYFGNAMMMMEGAQTKVLCDPWVTFDRYSQSGLYTFPELKMTKADIAELRPDFIYITHTHADHFDPITLAVFDKDTPVLVSYYENNFTARHVRELGFTDVRISDPDNGIALNGSDHCWIEPNGIYSEVDSLGVFKIDEITVLNANDNPYCEDQCRQLRKRFGQVDLACVPFTFQGPYPAFYENLSENERLAAAEKKKVRNFDILVDFVKTLEPKRLFPFPAGAVYGGKKALMYDYYGVGTVDEALPYLLERYDEAEIVLLSQRMSINLPDGEVKGTYNPLTYEDERRYLEDVAQQPGPFEKSGLFYVAPSERIDLTKMLLQARLRQQAWQERLKIDLESVFFLDVGEEYLYRLSLGDASVEKVRETDISDGSYEIFRMPYSLLIGMLTHHYNYSNVKTQHMMFFRKPDIYNPGLHILMSYLQL